tara:strand:+ start:1394 stop:2707 length:1314 start_codon:yes stop_codon:yes gene_type:complete
MSDTIKVQILELYRELRSVRKVGKALGIGKDKVNRIVRDAMDSGWEAYQPVGDGLIDTSDGETRTIQSSKVHTLEDLLRVARVDPAEWEVTNHKINAWEALGKDSEIITLHQVKASLTKRPSWWVNRVECKPIPREPRKPTRGPRLCVVIPDTQVGYRRLENGRLQPLHDVEAMDVALQLVEYLDGAHGIDEIVLIGDMLDLAPWGSYSTDLSLRWTTQPSLVALHHWISQLRQAARGAHCRYLAGNHEARIEKSLMDSATGEAVGLKPANSLDGKPLMSIPNLLSLDALDVDYIGPYGTPYWWQGVRFHHGKLVRSKGGQTVTAMLNQGYSHSQVVGHIHRREVASRTIPIPDAPGYKTITAMSPGCLCRLDGAVPHAKGSSQLDWQQAIGLIWADDLGHSMSMIPIDLGRAMYDGRTFVGKDRTDELREATGLPY